MFDTLILLVPVIGAIAAGVVALTLRNANLADDRKFKEDRAAANAARVASASVAAASSVAVTNIYRERVRRKAHIALTPHGKLRPLKGKSLDTRKLEEVHGGASSPAWATPH